MFEMQQNKEMNGKETKMNGPRNSVSEVTFPTMERIFKQSIPTLNSDDFIYFDLQGEGYPFYFSGLDSEYVLKHQPKEPFTISGQKFASVDEFMWTMKFRELANRPLPSNEERKGLGLGKYLFNHHYINKSKVETWFLNRGFLYLQKAILRRVQTDKSLYSKLRKEGSRFMVYTYVNDPFLGTGIPMEEMRKWMGEATKNGEFFKVPKKFPLQVKDLHHLPKLGFGRNVLGAMYMALHETTKSLDPYHMEVKIPPMTLNELPPPFPCQSHIPMVNIKKRQNSEDDFSFAASDSKRQRQESSGNFVPQESPQKSQGSHIVSGTPIPNRQFEASRQKDLGQSNDQFAYPPPPSPNHQFSYFPESPRMFFPNTTPTRNQNRNRQYRNLLQSPYPLASNAFPLASVASPSNFNAFPSKFPQPLNCSAATFHTTASTNKTPNTLLANLEILEDGEWSQADQEEINLDKEDQCDQVEEIKLDETDSEESDSKESHLEEGELNLEEEQKQMEDAASVKQSKWETYSYLNYDDEDLN